MPIKRDVLMVRLERNSSDQSLKKESAGIELINASSRIHDPAVSGKMLWSKMRFEPDF